MPNSISPRNVEDPEIASVSPLQIDQCVLESSRLAVHMSGLLSKKANEICYAEDYFGNYFFNIAKRTWPNNYARLDILFINGEPVGSIFALKHSDDLFHMVGMFLKEEFRGDAFFKKISREVVTRSPAAYFMEQYKKDLFLSSQNMTLEVMNYNMPAIKLYERDFSHGGKSWEGFRLLRQEEIVHYAQLRRKKIGRWHEVSDSNSSGCGVQWKHIPDYNNRTTWSISRVYLFNPKKIELEHIHCEGAFLEEVYFVRNWQLRF